MKELFSIRERETTWRIILGAIIFCSFALSGYAFYMAYETLELSKKNVYVLVNNNQLVQAQATDITNSQDILTKGAIRHMNELIYRQVPDPDQMNKQLKEAVRISDEKTKSLIDVYLQNGFFNSIVAQNYYSTLSTDSIAVNYAFTPHPFDFYGKLKIIRGNQSSAYAIHTSGEISYMGGSSEGNERGYIISNFKLVSDKQIQEQ